MATLTSDDYRAILQHIREDPVSRGIFKAWGLDKQTFYDLFQATENWFVAGFTTAPPTSFKAMVESITGTATNAQAKMVGYTWMGWRHDRNP